MTLLRSHTILGLFAILAMMAFACGDGGEGQTNDPTPSATPAVAPPPPRPEIGPSSREIGEGTFSADIQPGGTSSFDPLTLPLNPGAEVPSCAAYQFVFGWQVKNPYPLDSVKLIWRWVRADSTEEVASGASGTESIGCGFLEAVNQGTFEITVDAHYIIAETQP